MNDKAMQNLFLALSAFKKTVTPAEFIATLAEIIASEGWNVDIKAVGKPTRN